MQFIVVELKTAEFKPIVCKKTLTLAGFLGVEINRMDTFTFLNNRPKLKVQIYDVNVFTYLMTTALIETFCFVNGFRIKKF